MTQCSLSHPARKWGASLTSFTFTFNNWTKSSIQWFYHQNYCLLSSVYFYLLLLEAFKVASNLIWFSRFHLSPCWYTSILGTRVVPLPYTSNLIFLCETIPLLSIGLWDIFQHVLHRTNSANSTNIESVGGNLLVTYSVKDIYFPHMVIGITVCFNKPCSFFFSPTPTFFVHSTSDVPDFKIYFSNPSSMKSSIPLLWCASMYIT